MFKKILAVALCISSLVIAHAQSSNNSAIFRNIDLHINSGVEERFFPGGQLVIGNRDSIIYSKSYGYLDYSKRQSVNDSTIYDLASCTKIFSTTLAIMTLLDEGRITLNTKISDIVPYTDTAAYGKVMVKDLLYHGTGFKPVIPIVYSLVKSGSSKSPLMSRYKSATHPYQYDYRLYVNKNIKYDSTYISKTPIPGYKQIASELYLSPDYQLKIDTLVNKAYVPEKYGLYAYSDLNFYFLQKIVQYSTTTSLDDYVAEIYQRMGLTNIGYLPKIWADIDNVAPTEFDALFRRDTIKGAVHDEFASVLGGVGGHAGLFASAKALSGICQMFINYGVAANGEMIVDSSTIERFTQPKRYASGAIRALGFDKLDPNKSAYSYESYGHTGFTGTYFWVDPVKGYYVIFLTNRVHPTRANKKLGKNYREELWNQIKKLF